jgi:hypothetical protein
LTGAGRIGIVCAKDKKIGQDIMVRILIPLLAGLSLAACDGNPFPTKDGSPPSGPGGGIDSDGRLPPGTPSPRPGTAITRFEPKDDAGSGFVTDVGYDSVTDRFTVDNLGFDGDNSYTRGTAVSSLGPYAVYEGPRVAPDDVTGVPVGQFEHRAIYGVSPTARTQFAIVRTGSYITYGFGGFVYEREGGVTLPTKGFAAYTGTYSGMRDFNGRGGLEYVSGQADVAIDFNDFNSGNAVRGSVRNRTIFDIDGNDITGQVLTALAAETGVPQTQLPVLQFTVGPGVMDTNGEIVGAITSSVATDRGIEAFERGKYYAIVAGDNADEVVGVIVVEAADPRSEGVTVRETGGFILSRP